MDSSGRDAGRMATKEHEALIGFGQQSLVFGRQARRHNHDVGWNSRAMTARRLKMMDWTHSGCLREAHSPRAQRCVHSLTTQSQTAALLAVNPTPTQTRATNDGRPGVSEPGTRSGALGGSSEPIAINCTCHRFLFLIFLPMRTPLPVPIAPASIFSTSQGPGGCRWPFLLLKPAWVRRIAGVNI